MNKINNKNDSNSSKKNNSNSETDSSKLNFNPENIHEGYFVSDEDDEVGDTKFHSHSTSNSPKKSSKTGK